MLAREIRNPNLDPCFHSGRPTFLEKEGDNVEEQYDRGLAEESDADLSDSFHSVTKSRQDAQNAIKKE